MSVQGTVQCTLSVQQYSSLVSLCVAKTLKVKIVLFHNIIPFSIRKFVFQREKVKRKQTNTMDFGKSKVWKNHKKVQNSQKCQNFEEIDDSKEIKNYWTVKNFEEGRGSKEIKNYRNFRSSGKGKYRKKENAFEKVKADGDEVSSKKQLKGSCPANSMLKSRQIHQDKAPLPPAMVRENQILNKKSSGSLARVNWTASGPIDTNNKKTLEERIREMFENNNAEFTGIDFDNLKDDSKDLGDLMRSLSQEQVKALLLSASSNLVKVVSTRSEYLVGNHLILHVSDSFV